MHRSNANLAQALKALLLLTSMPIQAKNLSYTLHTSKLQNHVYLQEYIPPEILISDYLCIKCPNLSSFTTVICATISPITVVLAADYLSEIAQHTQY